MQPTSVIGLFCEDIREEKTGTCSLVGIMPDNATVPVSPPEGQIVMVPRLALYARIHFDPDNQLERIQFDVIVPDGTVISLGVIDQSVIDRAREDAKKQKSPLAGIVTRVIMGPLPLKKLGRLIAKLTIGKQEYIAAAVNFTSEKMETTALEVSHEVVQRL
jgi:hypothetical protein